jgi:hypothetical protein
MRSRQALLATTIAVSVTTGLASAASGGSGATISLTVTGTSAATVEANAGTAVSLVSRATLQSGDRILIVGVRTPETKARQVVSCSRSPCTGTWRESAAAVVKFQAGVLHGTGKAAKVLRESRILTVTWKPAALPALAQPGHYEGRSSQNEKFAFDVTPDGRNVVNLQTGPINGGCPNGAHTNSGDLRLSGTYPIIAAHTFSISIKNEAIVSAKGEAIKRSITITGSFAGTIASGTLLVEYDWPSNGGLCSSGNQTWTIPRVG